MPLALMGFSLQSVPLESSIALSSSLISPLALYRSSSATAGMFAAE
jgi:hypothetical protein